MWYQFYDMSSGGGEKLPYKAVYIEAGGEGEACQIFEAKLGRDPRNITCPCCGEDYAITESETLEDVSEYCRGIGGFAPRPEVSYDEFLETPRISYWAGEGKAMIVPRPPPAGSN